MSYWLNWINLDEAMALIVLIGILHFVSRQLHAETVETARRAQQITFLGFVSYAMAAICEWGAPTVTEFLVITVRATLAAGIVHAIASILCPPLFYAWAQMTAKPAPQLNPPSVSKPIDPNPEQRARIEAVMRQAELERQIKVNEAREEVEKYYSQHSPHIGDEYPPALFRAQLQIQFPPGIDSSQAWVVSRDMISEMLPLIAKAQDRLREERAQKQLEVLKREEQQREADELRRQINDRQSSFKKLVHWYQTEQQTIKQVLPEGPDQEDALHQVWERFDSLVKETYSEMRP